MPSKLQEKPEFRQEFRLGLVVYGGVSLAIYMNGVCREFYEAVRGRGIYKLIKALTDSDIIVDVVSGTSAGGVNGVLLSYALTNSNEKIAVEFENFANIWRESGDIGKLLRSVEPFQVPTPERKVNSLLDGEGYYESQLFQALQAAKLEPTRFTSEWFSESSELDLFVTGTDVLGKVSTAFDNTGRVIEVKDHRSVFHLKHRRDRKEPFVPEPITQRALAKLCRITSCFPVAFPVVCVKLDSSNDPDSKLVEWGALKNRSLPAREEVPLENRENGSRQLYFVDGGVLDNRPFSYTIQEIYYRTAYRPVERRLFYIDPSPDRFFDSPTYREMPKPNLLQVVGDSLVGMPSYESIANDLKAIEEHNQRVRRYRRLMAVIKDLPPQSQSSSAEAHQAPSNAEIIYLRCRFIELRDRVLQLLFQEVNESDNPDSLMLNRDKKQTLEKAAKLLTQSAKTEEERQEREVKLQGLSQEIRNLDVEYALRKHFYLLENIWQQMCGDQSETAAVMDGETYAVFKNLAGDISRQVELLEVVRSALSFLFQLDTVRQAFNSRLDAAAANQAGTVEVYDYLLKLHRFLLDDSGLEAFLPTSEQTTRSMNPLQPVPADFLKTIDAPLEPQKSSYGLSSQTISSIFEQLKRRAAQLNTAAELETLLAPYSYRGNENDNDQYRSILRRIERFSGNLIALRSLDETTNLLNKFNNFRDVDATLYSYEYLADFSSKEMIELFRISPNDADRGYGKGKNLNNKLAGDQFLAFGGFFKRSWRSNDILWGRLDGLNRLIDALITPEALKNFPNFVQRQSEQLGMEPADYLSELLTLLPQSSKAEEQSKIAEYLQKLQTDGALPSDEFEDFLNQLVTVGHRDILEADLDRVIQDEINEQLGWESPRVATASASSTTGSVAKPAVQYMPTTGAFNQTINTLMAQSLATNALKDLDRESFFKDGYQVGSETLTGSIPEIVLKNLIARTGLILRDVIASFPSDPIRYQGLRNNRIYRLGNKLLQFFYLSVQRKSPKGLQSSAASRQLFWFDWDSILLFFVVASIVVILASLVALAFKLPLFGLTLLGVVVLALSVLALRWFS
ncbi:MAG TPA: patatin-like protein [Trichocoleus sp.]|jgi:patatin-related protein